MKLFDELETQVERSIATRRKLESGIAHTLAPWASVCHSLDGASSPFLRDVGISSTLSAKCVVFVRAVHKPYEETMSPQL